MCKVPNNFEMLIVSVILARSIISSYDRFSRIHIQYDILVFCFQLVATPSHSIEKNHLCSLYNSIAKTLNQLERESEFERERKKE